MKVWSCNDCGVTFVVKVGVICSGCPACGSPSVQEGE